MTEDGSQKIEDTLKVGAAFSRDNHAGFAVTKLPLHIQEITNNEELITINFLSMQEYRLNGFFNSDAIRTLDTRHLKPDTFNFFLEFGKLISPAGLNESAAKEK